MLEILFQFELSKNIKQAKKIKPRGLSTYLIEVGKASHPQREPDSKSCVASLQKTSG